jgi:DeoR C terminal sensor domain
MYVVVFDCFDTFCALEDSSVIPESRRSRILVALNLQERTSDDELATEPTLPLPATQHRIETQLIGNRTGRLFRAGDSLFVDAGSTTIACAAALATVRGLTVIPNSLDVALRLMRAWDARAHFLGSIETVGAQVMEQIAAFRPDHAVFTVSAIDEDDNVSDVDHDEAMVARDDLAGPIAHAACRSQQVRPAGTDAAMRVA